MEQFLDLFQGYSRSESDAAHTRVVAVVDRRESTGQLNGLPRIEHKYVAHGPISDDRIEHTILEVERFSMTEWQIVGTRDLDCVTDIEQRFATRGVEVSQRQEVHALVLIIRGNIGETLGPSPISSPVQSFRKPLPKLH